MKALGFGAAKLRCMNRMEHGPGMAEAWAVAWARLEVAQQGPLPDAVVSAAAALRRELEAREEMDGGRI